jgi:hypothetical protein
MTQRAGSVKAQRAVAGLMSPYVAWLAFATALTARLAKDNPDVSGWICMRDFAAERVRLAGLHSRLHTLLPMINVQAHKLDTSPVTEAPTPAAAVRKMT